MATFTIDLLTGNLYLFDGDFTGSGGTPTSGSTYPQVNLFASLPSPASSSGQIYVVRNGSGTTVLNRKPAGLYYSTGSVWRYLGDTPDAFKSDNFQIIDSLDNTKGVMIQTSGITTGTFPTLTIQDSDGTLAYLTDLNTKVNISAFADYTGTTATEINNKLDTSVFNAYTGGTGNISKKIQVVSTGVTNVNTVIATAIDWDSADPYVTDTYSYTAGTSTIEILSGGTFEVQYHITLQNDSANQTHSVGAYLILTTAVTTTTLPVTATAGMIVGPNVSGELSLPPVVLTLNTGDKLDLAGFRIGNSGVVNTVSGSVYLVLNKIS